MKKVLILFFAVLSGVASVSGQTTGIITGKVVDKQTGEELIGANVRVADTQIGASSDIDGNYRIAGVPAGPVSLKISYVSYRTQTITGVKVVPGQVTRQDVLLELEEVQTEEVLVEATVVRNSDGILLLDRKKSATIMDAISAEQIKKSTDSNAGDAMKRVTGVTVVGGKFVYVRGLGERYSNTTLNGASVPSPEPEKKVVPFDIFPSSLIQNMTTSKSFTPDQSGDFAGGSVQISTVEFPDQETFSYSIGSGYNSNTLGKSVPTATTSGSLDFLGYDDGTRALPSDYKSRLTTLYTGPDKAADFSRSLKSGYGISNQTVAPNQSYSMTYGNQFDLGVPVGVIAAVTYSNSGNYTEEDQFFPSAESLPTYELDGRSGNNSVLWGTILNGSVKLSNYNKLSFKNLFNTSSDAETRVEEGILSRSGGGYIRATREKFVSRSLLSSQVAGEHHLASLLNTRAEWKATYSRAMRSEPDTRESVYQQEQNGQFAFANNYGSSNGRFFSDMADNDVNLKLDLSTPFTQWDGFDATLKYGGVVKHRTRDFDGVRIQYGLTNTSSDSRFLNPADLLTPDQIGSGLVSLSNATADTDGYEATENHAAGYAMVDMPVYPGLRMITGFRYEQNTIDLSVYNPLTNASGFVLPTRSSGDMLGAFHLVYTPVDNVNYRFAVSRTLARPEFRELAPASYYDYKSAQIGNPLLKDVAITNYDLRWEWFVKPGDIVAVSLFYKDFTNPIEQAYIDRSGTTVTVPVNANTAYNMGMEIELRSDLDVLHSSLSEFKFISNVTLVKSESGFNKNQNLQYYFGNQFEEISPAAITNLKRPMLGQSPYVINTMLVWDREEWGSNVSLAYNRFGERISTFGIVFGSLRVDDIYEMPRDQVDLAYSQKFFEKYSFKMNVRNLLNDETIFRFGKSGDVHRSYRTGMSVSAGISYSL
ncbi:MAG: carboxypeptidase-like regulatory domain-containing protein [Bacteroidetes bacterium]|nr:carboxypeptidase-like regulatory domain-containing protein [Bacteroidota bacterium]